MENQPDFKAWYCEVTEQVRVASTPGGVGLTAEQARELRDQLNEAIERAE